MRNVGFISSSVAHILILGVGLVSLPSADRHDVADVEILPIELVTIADVTDVKKGDAKAEVKEKVQEKTKKAPEPKKEPPKKPAPKNDPKPKPEAPKPKAEPSPPKPQEDLKPEPVKPETKPEAKPEPPKPPKAEAPKMPKQITAIPKVKPKPPKKKVVKKKPPKKKRVFDSDALKALANKAENSSPTNEGAQDQKASFGSRNGKQAAAMTQSELDALRAQVAQCWSPPVGAADASQLVVKIQFGLDRDGNVTSGPKAVEFPASQFGVAAVESAMRAVRRCAPYSLPADKYGAWQQVRIRFDPQDMF